MQAPPPPKYIFAGSRQDRIHARQYWILHPVIGGLQYVMQHILRRLPTPWVSDFGAWMSRFSPARYPESDARARRAWRRLRPDSSDAVATEAAIRRVWESTGRLQAELPILDRLWDEGRIEVEGREYLEIARASGRPIIVASVHLGNWEVIAVATARLGFPGAGVALVLENRFADQLITRLRNRVGGRVIPALPTSGRAMVREIQERGPLLIYVDDFSRGVVHAPSFGRMIKPNTNISYVARLAKHTGAAVIPLYCTRIDDEARFKVTILPECKMDINSDAKSVTEDNARSLDATFEPIVLRHLDQWFYLLDLEIGDA